MCNIHNQVKMKPLWMRGDSKPTMGVLLSKGKSGHRIHVHRANTTGGWRQRRECFIYKSKMPTVASDETRKDLPLEPPERTEPCGHLDSGHSASRPGRECISVLSSHGFVIFCLSSPRQLKYPGSFGALLYVSIYYTVAGFFGQQPGPF